MTVSDNTPDPVAVAREHAERYPNASFGAVVTNEQVLADTVERLQGELAALRADAADQEDRMFDDLTRQLHTINTLNAFARDLATAIGHESEGDGWVEKAAEWWKATVAERDEARTEVERLQGELAWAVAEATSSREVLELARDERKALRRELERLSAAREVLERAVSIAEQLEDERPQRVTQRWLADARAALGEPT